MQDVEWEGGPGVAAPKHPCACRGSQGSPAGMAAGRGARGPRAPPHLGGGTPGVKDNLRQEVMFCSGISADAWLTAGAGLQPCARVAGGNRHSVARLARPR